jgi:hypothetical protein
MSWLNTRNELPSPSARQVCPWPQSAAQRSLFGWDVGVAVGARGRRIDVGQGAARRADSPQPAGGVPRPVFCFCCAGSVMTALHPGVRFWCHRSSRTADIEVILTIFAPVGEATPARPRAVTGVSGHGERGRFGSA